MSGHAVEHLISGITLGILGGGQLGRMSAVAAARLGIDVVIFCPEDNAPASHVSKATVTASYDDREALQDFAGRCDYISYEFENIPVETIDYLDSLKPGCVRPTKALLEVSQDRLKEKAFLNAQGIETAQWRSVSCIEDVKAALGEWGTSAAIVKTARFGYDGKGQMKISAQQIDDGSAGAFFDKHDGQAMIMESVVPFRHEVSVVVARDIHKNTETYGPMLNEHRNHILHKTHIGDSVTGMVGTKPVDMAKKLAEAVDLTGVMTIEFFMTEDGHILANEIAPRTHNSGHWSIEACTASQFENHVRSVCGLPLGPSKPHCDAEMLNLIGDDVLEVEPYLMQNGAYVHLYGKRSVRAGRKMGHVTFLKI